VPPSSRNESDPVVGHARVVYAIPIRQSEVMAWSKPGLLVPDDPEDDAWIFEVQEAVTDRLPDLLERAGQPDVEFE
jgi:hypothetical protein